MKVTNKGNNIKSTEAEGWDKEFKWNKWLDKCNSYTEDLYFYASVHHAFDGFDII